MDADKHAPCCCSCNTCGTITGVVFIGIAALLIGYGATGMYRASLYPVDVREHRELWQAKAINLRMMDIINRFREKVQLNEGTATGHGTTSGRNVPRKQMTAWYSKIHVVSNNYRTIAPSLVIRKQMITKGQALYHYDCFSAGSSGKDYKGRVNHTVSGLVCQAWASQKPHPHIMGHYAPNLPETTLAATRNYCRNPEDWDGDGTWCYTTNVDIRWEYCDVPKCSDN